MDDDKKKKKEDKDPFEELFGSQEMGEEFKKFQKMAQDMIRKSMENPGTNPFVGGFSLTLGPDGMPRMKSVDASMECRDEKELTPLSDVQDRGNEILVTVDIPGVEKEDIQVEVKGRKLIIDTEGTRRYHTEIDLPGEVQGDCSEASYRNGVLEITLKKNREKGQSIEVN